MAENGVAFRELNVGEDRQAREEMIKKTGQMGVPVIEIDGETVIGFDQAALKQKLSI